jgi:hypothetical protein
MNYIKYIFGLVSLALLINLSSCKEECPCDDPTDPVCDNYDPCFGKDTINTFFKVRPGDRGFAPPEEWCDLVACDTFNASSVRFDIPEGNPENSTYEWQIGSEAEPRTGEGFEVDFSDYLRDNGWETWIPITLTVRTPMNECLRSEDETVKMVTRQLFFTEKRPSIFDVGQKIVSYKGCFLSKPREEITIEFIYQTEGFFRGIDSPIALVTGVPGIDTFAYNPPCKQSYCVNYLHTLGRIENPTNCFTSATNYLSEIEFLSIAGIKRIKRMWVFDKPTGRERYEFIGERIE